MANIVTQMSKDQLDAYICFIAFHLAVIDGARQPKMRYADRARALNVTRDQFNYRTKQGFLYCQRELNERLH